jgi:hypothetical protein
MTRKKSKGNGTGTVYPRKNGDGKVIGYRGAYHGPDGNHRCVQLVACCREDDKVKEEVLVPLG